jgi:hypothetical protein
MRSSADPGSVCIAIPKATAIVSVRDLIILLLILKKVQAPGAMPGWPPRKCSNLSVRAI